jgi:hypothetical protein
VKVSDAGERVATSQSSGERDEGEAKTQGSAHRSTIKLHQPRLKRMRAFRRAATP